MFGYVRPLKSKFTGDEEARFKCVYCGLCYALGKRYGKLTRLILNYDLAFMALLLGAFKEDSGNNHTRCPAKPFKGSDYRPPDETLSLCADLSVILTYHKLLDEIEDESFVKSLSARFLKLWMRPKYRKAAGYRPDFDKTVRLRLLALSEIEKEKNDSIDKAADTFAEILSAAACETDFSEKNSRILTHFLYHLGRWIYLVDAVNDLEDDMKKKRYNPVALRYSLSGRALSGDERRELLFTLENSLSNIAGAFELLELSRDRDVLSDIIYFGLKAVTLQILTARKGAKNGRSL
ncbi:MAG: DUF5685 family protein [Bacillota bacterium]|nr:DUF5685 family protein [Bacillota bacterium]